MPPFHPRPLAPWDQPAEPAPKREPTPAEVAADWLRALVLGELRLAEDRGKSDGECTAYWRAQLGCPPELTMVEHMAACEALAEQRGREGARADLLATISVLEQAMRAVAGAGIDVTGLMPPVMAELAKAELDKPRPGVPSTATSCPPCPAVEPGTGHACHGDADSTDPELACESGVHACSATRCYLPGWYTPPHPQATHGLDGKPLAVGGPCNCPARRHPDAPHLDDCPATVPWRSREVSPPQAPALPALAGREGLVVATCPLDADHQGSHKMHRPAGVPPPAKVCGVAASYLDPLPRCDRPGHSGLTCSGCAADLLQDFASRFCLKKAGEDEYIAAPVLFELLGELSRLQSAAATDPAELRIELDLLTVHEAEVRRQTHHDPLMRDWQTRRLELVGRARARIQAQLEQPPSAAGGNAP